MTVAVYFPAMAAVTGAVRGALPCVAANADDPPGLSRVVRDGTWLAMFVGVPMAGTVLIKVAVLAVAAVPAARNGLTGLWAALAAANLAVVAGQGIAFRKAGNF